MNFQNPFWNRVAITSSDKCWSWQGAVSTGKRGGYGHYTRNYKQIKAHRTAFELFNNVVLSSKEKILHRCDNPICCNPYHLVKGTAKDNMIDMVKKDRSTSKLTIKDVKEIKVLLTTFSQTAIAKRFGVTQSTINRISTGKRWGGIL